MPNNQVSASCDSTMNEKVGVLLIKECILCSFSENDYVLELVSYNDEFINTLAFYLFFGCFENYAGVSASKKENIWSTEKSILKQSPLPDTKHFQ